MGGSKQQSNQIKLLVWMDGTITVNTSDASAPLLVFLQGLRGVKHERKWQTNSREWRVAAIAIWNYVAKGCYCERLLTTAPNNSHGGQASANGSKITKDGEEKSVRHALFWHILKLFCKLWSKIVIVSYVSGLCTEERTSASTSSEQTRFPSVTPG